MTSEKHFDVFSLLVARSHSWSLVCTFRHNLKFVLEPRLAHKGPVTQAIVLKQGHAEETSKTRTTEKLIFT